MKFNKKGYSMLEKERKLTSVEIIVSQSDLNGFIIYANPIFYKIAGYPYGKLIGENHNIIRHPEMPKTIFKYLWEKLKEKQEVYCFIKNKSKDNRYYWVFTYIRPAINRDGVVRNYISTRRAMSNKAKAIIEPLYQQLLDVEKSHGLQASEKLFNTFMEQNRYKNQSNNEIIHTIQY
jgi:PAS domain S-box-containing protein